MKVALANPPYTLEERYSTKISNKIKYCLPPLGILYVAAASEKAGHEVSIFDFEARPDLDIEELRYFDIIGITALTPNFPNAVKLLKRIKCMSPNIKIVFGGPHASEFYEEIMQTLPEVDFCVVGEGEITFPALLKHIENSEGIPGVVFRNKASVVYNCARPYIEDLDSILFPARHFVNMKDYQPLGNSYRYLPLANMISSRGCPYGKCTFCFEAGRLGPKYRKRSPENVVAEIEQCIKEYNIREVSFWDDDFIPDVDWLSRFKELLKKKKISISWSCSQRANLLNERNVKIMAEAGCWTVFLGIETGNEESLKRIQKGITLEEYLKAVKICHKFNIEIRGSFILGLPGETPAMGRKTIQFAINSKVDFAQFCICSPLKGTRMHDDLINSGVKLSNDLKDYNAQTPAFIPEGYTSLQQIKRLQKNAYKRFYLRPAFIWKRICSLKNMEELKRYYQGFMMLLGVVKQ